MSAERWVTKTLGEIAEVVMGQSPAGDTCNNIGEGTPLLNGPTEFGGNHPNPIQFTTNPRKFAEAGDLLFCVRGSTTGKMNWADQKYAIGRGLAALRHRSSFSLQPFLKGIIDSYLPSLLAEATGSTFPNVSSQQLHNLMIEVPDILTQAHIADILSMLDEKIELNRQTNATLEAIAQTVFKEWFVDFRFPGATGDMQDSEIGSIPLGWKTKKLEGIVSIKHGFAFKGIYFSEEETDEILITPGNVRIGGGFNYSKFKYYDGVYPPEYLLNDGDLIVTMTDLSKNGDTLGYPALVPQIFGKKLLHNQRIGKLEFHKESILKLYLYFVMRQNDYKNYVLSGATGTTVRHTSPGRICDYMLVIPTTTVLRQFEKVIQGLINNIEFSFLENQVLAQTRDVLLPKLMSGEIKV